MRVRRDNKSPVDVGHILQLTVGNDNQSVKVRGKVVWKKRTAWRTIELGVQFLEVRPGIAEALTHLAQHGFISADPPPTGAPQDSGSAGPSARPGAALRATMEVEDLYAVLGVTHDATAEEIRVAYRALAFQHHPDVSKDPATAGRFALISKSYSVLKNLDMKERYDEMLARSVSRKAG